MLDGRSPELRPCTCLQPSLNTLSTAYPNTPPHSPQTMPTLCHSCKENPDLRLRTASKRSGWPWHKRPPSDSSPATFSRAGTTAARKLCLRHPTFLGLPVAFPPQLIALLVIAWSVPTVAAELPLLHPLFGTGAVMQRDRPVTVWGWTEAHAAVAVTMTRSDATSALTVHAIAAADGRWEAELPSAPAGGAPATLRVVSGASTVESQDLLFGDVWLCSGQSNMERTVSAAQNFPAEKAAVTFPAIRHFKVPKHIAGEPQATVTATWTACAPDTVGNFTAVGYFFARDLVQRNGVPIGLINSSVGGTAIECWLSDAALEPFPEFTKPVAEFRLRAAAARRQATETGRNYADLAAAWYATNDAGSAAHVPWSAEVLPAEGWSPLQLPSADQTLSKIIPPTGGVVWLRREIEVPADPSPTVGGRLRIGRITDLTTAWINGQRIGATEDRNQIQDYQVPAGVLRPGRNSIALRVTCLAGKGGFMRTPEPVIALTPTTGAPIPLPGEWLVRLGIDFARAPTFPESLARTAEVTSLHHGMIAPHAPIGLRGALWYQGEANTGRSDLYRRLLPSLISAWRTTFRNPELPFLVVQLPNYLPRAEQPSDTNWARFREAQAQAVAGIPQAGLTINLDLGEADEIHPKNKQDVGHRLALLARSQVYGEKISAAGPIMQTATPAGEAFRLTFAATGALTTTDRASPTGFAIAGEDRRFVWAQAHVDGNTILVSSPQVPKPIAVRYAWADNPAINLTDASGLPAAPFRTDDWPKQAP